MQKQQLRTVLCTYSTTWGLHVPVLLSLKLCYSRRPFFSFPLLRFPPPRSALAGPPSLPPTLFISPALLKINAASPPKEQGGGGAAGAAGGGRGGGKYSRE